MRFLREHGITVEVGDGAEAVVQLLRPYLKWRATSRPYVIAKFAVSLDGKVGNPGQGITWLTSGRAVERAHLDRAWVDAIAVGSGTVVADDPALTARADGVATARQPVRVVLDGSGRSPVSARAFGPGAIVATTRAAGTDWRARIAATGATVLELEAADPGVNLDQMLLTLGRRNILSLIVEGGPTLLEALFRDDHVDEVHAYIAPIILGEGGLPLFPVGGFSPARLRDVVVESLAPDVLVRGYTGTWSPG